MQRGCSENLRVNMHCTGNLFTVNLCNADSHWKKLLFIFWMSFLMSVHWDRSPASQVTNSSAETHLCGTVPTITSGQDGASAMTTDFKAASLLIRLTGESMSNYTDNQFTVSVIFLGKKAIWWFQLLWHEHSLLVLVLDYIQFNIFDCLNVGWSYRGIWRCQTLNYGKGGKLN